MGSNSTFHFFPQTLIACTVVDLHQLNYFFDSINSAFDVFDDHHHRRIVGVFEEQATDYHIHEFSNVENPKDYGYKSNLE